MLIRCGRSVFGGNPGRFTGYSGEIGNIVKGGLRNRFAGGLSQTFGGYANGHLHPASFILPQKAGSISSYTEAAMAIAPTVAILTPAMPMAGSAALTLTAGTLQLDKIIAMVASGGMVISVNSALLSSVLSMVGSGTLTITGSAQLGGIFDVTGSSSMILVPSCALTAQAFMIAEAGGPTPLSPEGLANAVWSKLASDANDPGTMGEKVNDAGSASNPWTEIIEGSLSAADILKLLLSIQAGETTITDLGGGNATVKFKDLSGAVDRVTASVSGSERTSVTLNPS